MRMVLSVLLLVGLLLAPAAHGEPQSCPPVCDQIPDTAWIAPAGIPLNTVYHWPRPAAVAVAEVGPPRFRFEELCNTPPPVGGARDFVVAGRATIPRPANQWQLQAQALHWRGETWRGGELAASVFNGAVDALRSCQRGAPGQSPSLTIDEPDRMAAVVSGPVLMHTYLLAHPQSSTLAALTLWSSAPPRTPWPPIDDAGVLDALAAPLCAAYLGSCG